MKNNPLPIVALVCFALIATACSASEPKSISEWIVRPSTGLSIPRAAHQTTAISPTLVLVTGGCSGTGCTPVERSAELLRIETGRSEVTRPMNEARVAHAAALLKDGRVLVVGGWTGDMATASAEVFEQQHLSFSPVQAMATARMDATATPLLNGLVLVTGGASATNLPVSHAEVFDSTQNRFVAVGTMHEARAHHAAVRMQDGRVLVVGGQRGPNLATDSAEIYDPTTKSFTLTGSMQLPRCKHAAVLLKDGRVMVIAGSSDCDDRRRTAQTEIYDPRTGQFTAGPPLLNARYKIIDATTVLPSGDVVVAGDATDAEVWTPGTPAFIEAIGSIDNGLAFSTATPLPNGSVQIIGGYDNDIRPTAQAWIINRARSTGNPN